MFLHFVFQVIQSLTQFQAALEEASLPMPKEPDPASALEGHMTTGCSSHLWSCWKQGSLSVTVTVHTVAQWWLHPSRKQMSFCSSGSLISHPPFTKRMSQSQGEKTCSSPERASKYLEAMLNVCINMQRVEMLAWIPLVKDRVEPGYDILLTKCLRDHQAISYCVTVSSASVLRED